MVGSDPSSAPLRSGRRPPKRKPPHAFQRSATHLDSKPPTAWIDSASLSPQSQHHLAEAQLTLFDLFDPSGPSHSVLVDPGPIDHRHCVVALAATTSLRPTPLKAYHNLIRFLLDPACLYSSSLEIEAHGHNLHQAIDSTACGHVQPSSEAYEVKELQAIDYLLITASSRIPASLAACELSTTEQPLAPLRIILHLLDAL